MVDRATATHPHHTANFGRAVAPALAVVLFAAVLLFAILVSLRYAHGWVEVVSEGAAAALPMAADGLVAFVSALVTAVGVVWLYLRQLAR
ncbi:MAG TPA: hypothetical protein VII80_01370 [Pseudolabrys sp.]|jgi:hypothetical protein